jgi:Flp pilus assembly CpaF family ATPase
VSLRWPPAPPADLDGQSQTEPAAVPRDDGVHPAAPAGPQLQSQQPQSQQAQPAHDPLLAQPQRFPPPAAATRFPPPAAATRFPPVPPPAAPSRFPPPAASSRFPPLAQPPQFAHLAAPLAEPVATIAPVLPGGLTDPRLIDGIGDVTAMMATQLDDGASTADVMPVIRETARRWLEAQVRSGQLPASAGGELDRLARAVYDQRYGLGPLSDYLRDPQVENVDVNGCDQVWITYASGERVAGPPVATTDEALVAMIRTWATRGGQTARDFSAAAPLVNVALTGSARMTATMEVTPRPCVSLRRHGQPDITLGGLVQLGSIDPAVAAFLSAAVRARCNIIVTGGVNAGKTTLLRALASEIPPDERVATLESEYELYLHELGQHPDVIAFEAREPNSEGVGGITLHDLVAHALRHNPRRILVGEVRRDEIMPMLEAMNSGQDGSMCTMHANSPAEAFDRILILGLRGGLALAERAIHILVGMAVDLIVHVRRGYDGARTVRFVTEILEVMPPGDTDRPAVNRLFLPDSQTGRATAAHTPSPGMLARLSAAGFDAGLLDQHRAGFAPANGAPAPGRLAAPGQRPPRPESWFR